MLFIALLELIMICVGEVAVADAINIIYALSVFFLSVLIFYGVTNLGRGMKDWMERH